MDYQFPNVLLDYFAKVALKSVDNDGQVETLALAVGRKVDEKIVVEELIFPAQSGKSDQVEDKGKQEK